MVVLPCWIHIPNADKKSKGDAEVAHRMYIMDTFLSKNYVYTYRKFKPENLIITEIFRFTGSILSLTKVIGIIDLEDSHIPFFVREESVETLKRKINEAKRYYVIP